MRWTRKRVPVAQLDRAPASGAGCRWFESTQAHHFLFFLFLFALLIRFFYLFQVGRSPFFVPPPGLDPSLYHQWALSIAKGEGMGKDVYHAMPLYPYLLGALYSITRSGLFWAKAIQLVLGAFNVVLVYRLGKYFFDEKVGAAAALCQLFSGASIFYEELLVPSSLIQFLFLITLFFLTRASREKGYRNWIGASASLALASLAQAGVILFFPVLLPWIFFQSGTLRKKIVSSLLLLSFLMLAQFSVFLRNDRVAGDATFSTAHAGINFYIGNHPGASGRFESLFSGHTSSEQLLEESKRVAQQTVARPLKTSEASDFWFRKGAAFIFRDPPGFLKLLGKKCLLFWNGHEIPDVEDYDFFRSRFSVLKWTIPFGWVAPLGLLGLGLGLRNFRKLFLLYGFLGSQMTAILLFFVNSRYRMPLISFILLFAGQALVWGIEAARHQKYRSLWLALFVFLHLVFITHLDIGSANEELGHYNLGIVLDHGGDSDGAIREFQKALFFYPEDTVFLFALANAHFRKGDYGEARGRYEEILSHDPHHADALFNLGLLDFDEGRMEEAAEYFKKSASSKTDLPDVYYLLSVIYRKKGMTREADEAKQKALALGADPLLVEKEPERPRPR